MVKDALGDRMKDYESIPKIRLTHRTPVIIRADGKAFHTFCKRFERPYDKFFNNCMNAVMKYICENVQGAKFAERHSDEISIFVTDYDKPNTDSYFDYEVQKVVSVVASMATAELCKQLLTGGEIGLFGMGLIDGGMWDMDTPVYKPLSFEEDWPTFDCRCFNIPESEVENYFWWRMLDATRNSINMLAQSKFSHKRLQGKTCNEMQEMLFQEHGINWNDIHQGQKSGFCCKKISVQKMIDQGPRIGDYCLRSYWDVQPSAASKVDLDKILSDVLHKEEM